MKVGMSMVLFAAGVITAQATYGDYDLPPCVCKDTWVHSEFKCNSTTFGGIMSATFNGCPDLTELEKCEHAPQQSWCETTVDECRQQAGESVDDGWVFCNAETKQPELPYCTCKAKWWHTEGACANMKGGMRMSGCPTHEEIMLCEGDMDDHSGQSWCETEEEYCQEQVDWTSAEDSAADTTMMGKGWSHCNPETGVAELPNCKCGSDGADIWQPDKQDCQKMKTDDVAEHPTFTGCPSKSEFEIKCGADIEEGADLPWCKTLQPRCKQQSHSVAYSSMVNESWSYCDAATEKAVYPTCDCMDNWVHEEGKCSGRLSMEMKGCPSLGEISKCEFHAEHSWCDTTYDSCAMQSNEFLDEQWSFCKPETQESELPPCECKSSWVHAQGDGITDICTKDHAAHFRGCPTLEQIQQCEMGTDQSWCDTTADKCRDQDPENFGQSWSYCDPVMQSTVHYGQAGGSSVGKAVGVTFVLTVILCVGLFIGFLLGYRRFLNRHKRGYSQDLLEGASESEQ